MIQSFRGVNWKIFCLFDRLTATLLWQRINIGPQFQFTRPWKKIVKQVFGHKCLVFIVVPPEKPRIYTVDDSQEVRLKLGPYNIGDTVRLRCVSLGGHPQPKVTWWRDHALLDSSDSNQVSFKTENELILKDLQRDDLHSILTCQASNNNISVPVSTSVKLDMNCK